MHSKMKGGIGVAKVATYLLSHDVPCFVEFLCDNSEVDLIAETPQGLKTIQVRSAKTTKGSVRLSLLSITPGTRTSPCKVARITGTEVFALYVIDKDVVLFIDADEIEDRGANITFRFDAARNHQKQGIRWASDYLEPSFLKGR